MNSSGKAQYKRGPVGQSVLDGPGFNIDPDFQHVLAFDCETETGLEAANTGLHQRLRVGGFLVKDIFSDTVIDAGLFVSDRLNRDDRQVVLDYAENFRVHLRALMDEHPEGSPHQLALQPFCTWIEEEALEGRSLPVLTRDGFAGVLLDYVQNDTLVIGHNLQFDISTIATNRTGYESSTRGTGFEYCLCDCPVDGEIKRSFHEFPLFAGKRYEHHRHACSKHPSIVTKKLSGKKVQYGLSDGMSSAPFIDTMVLGQSLLGQVPAGLDMLGKSFRCRIKKRPGETIHGDKLIPDYMTYLVQDICATMELFEREKENYDGHKLGSPVSSLYSNASLGKAYLSHFGIPSNIRARPFYKGDTLKKIDPTFYLDKSIEGYRGGRSEVFLRGVAKPVAYCDFRSQYPTINALCKLQDFLTSKDFRVNEGSDVIARARGLLNEASHDWLADKDNWPKLRIIVEIDPAGCRLPNKWDEKADDGSWDDGRVFGLADFKHQENHDLRWVPLADVVASKLFTEGFIPEIVNAFEVVPGTPMVLPTRNLFGDPRLQVDLSKDDLFVKLIEERKKLQNRNKTIEKEVEVIVANDASFANLDKLGRKKAVSDYIERSNSFAEEYYSIGTIEYGLKILANATSYGIYVEVRTENKQEVSGSYYAPFLASFITSGARLLLCLSQTLARDIGRRVAGQPIFHAMTDTDSMAFIRPDDLDDDTFNRIVSDIQAYFMRMSPYSDNEPQFDREREVGIDGKLWFYGVSAKRYCLFTIEGERKIKFNKISSHGTGPYQFDRNLTCEGLSAPEPEPEDIEGLNSEDYEPSDQEPLPAIDAPSVGVKWKPWQVFMWTRAIERAMGWRKPDATEKQYHAGFPDEPWNKNMTRMPQSITTPAQLHQFAMLDARPNSFFIALPNVEGSPLRIVMPRSDTEANIREGKFYDAVTGSPLPYDVVKRHLTTLRQSLAEYFVNPERKAKGEGHGINQKPGYLETHKVGRMATKVQTRKSQIV